MQWYMWPSTKKCYNSSFTMTGQLRSWQCFLCSESHTVCRCLQEARNWSYVFDQVGTSVWTVLACLVAKATAASLGVSMATPFMVCLSVVHLGYQMTAPHSTSNMLFLPSCDLLCEVHVVAVARQKTAHTTLDTSTSLIWPPPYIYRIKRWFQEV